MHRSIDCVQAVAALLAVACSLIVRAAAQPDRTVTIDAGVIEGKERLDLVEQATEVHAQLSPEDTTGELHGTSWQLVQFQGGDDTVLAPDAKATYTITFEPDGHVHVQIDCNRGRSTWTSSGPNHLQLGPLALTRVMCPPGSLHDHIVKQWEFVQSYTIKDGHLAVREAQGVKVPFSVVNGLAGC